MEKILDGKKVIALVFRKNINSSGTQFLTNPTSFIQVGTHTATNNILTKLHKNTLDKPKLINKIQEFVYLEKGNAEIYFKKKNGEIFSTIKLNKKDSVLILDGYHQFLLKKGSKVIEVKQGPYEEKT